MNNEQRKTLTETVNNLKASIEELDRALSANVLDGTPFAIVGDFTPAPESGLLGNTFQMILVEDSVGRCFRALDVQPNHFCGVILKSRESAERAVATLLADTKSTLKNPRYVHIRALREQRRTQQQNALAHIEKMLA